MPKFKLTLSDTVTYERLLPLIVEAETEQEAHEKVMQFSDELMTVYSDKTDEIQIDNTPYETELDNGRSSADFVTVDWKKVIE